MTTPYSSLPNEFRRRVLAQEPVIGCWASLASPNTTEVLGYAGFDWILLDGEHAPNDVISFVPQLMALKESVSAPVVRPSWLNAIAFKRLLDAGFYNFLVPFIDSAEQAREAVAATRYPPAGIRGVSVSTRSNKFGTVPDYFTKVNEHICVMAQIEGPIGLAAADEIAAVDGIDCLFVGPSDLSATLGHFGNPKHPDVQKAIADIFAAAKRQGKASGILAPVEEDARRYLSMGCTVVAVGSDLGVFRAGTQALRNKFMESK
ncbi:2-dehydro-3-deoxyglucarate aldolase [soil metagenome]